MLVCVGLGGFYAIVLFLKRSWGVSEARGSSCCVPSYFPASVSTWRCAGCLPGTPRRPARQPRFPSASSGCFSAPGCRPLPRFASLFDSSPPQEPLPGATAGSAEGPPAASGGWRLWAEELSWSRHQSDPERCRSASSPSSVCVLSSKRGRKTPPRC